VFRSRGRLLFGRSAGGLERMEREKKKDPTGNRSIRRKKNTEVIFPLK